MPGQLCIENVAIQHRDYDLFSEYEAEFGIVMDDVHNSTHFDPNTYRDLSWLARTDTHTNKRQN